MINGKPQAAAEGAHAAAEKKSRPRQSRQSGGDHAVAFGEFCLDLPHRQASADTHPAVDGIEMDRPVPEAQINGPVLIFGAATGGATATKAQW